MKKMTFIAAVIVLSGISSLEVSAQVSTQQGQTQATQQSQQDKKEKVTQEQLPEPVKAALKSDTYKDWTIGEIYKVAPVEGDTQGLAVYEVSMTNAQGQTGSIKIDEKGADASSKQ